MQKAMRERPPKINRTYQGKPRDKDNARTVAAGGGPQVSMLLFISDGSGGTGFSEDEWRGFQRDYLAGVENGRSVELDCPHYVHDHEYKRISAEITNFIQALPQ